VALRRFFAKELIGFEKVELEFESGLTVFTGASGSGKSVLMEGVLSVFGYKEPKALSAEAQTDMVFAELEEMGVDNEEPNVFRYLKKDKARYFVNANSIAKKDIATIAKLFSFYLSSKEDSDFTNERLISILDSFVKEENFLGLKDEYSEVYSNFVGLSKELAKLKEKSIKAAEEKEFLEFELKKFSEIDPKEGEEEELLELKKELSKKEKVSILLAKMDAFLSHKSAVLELFEFSGKDKTDAESFFLEAEEAVGEVDFKLSKLGSVNIDLVFERLEKLSYLNKRYGGIDDAIAYFEAKKEELKELEELDSRISSLELDIKGLSKQAKTLSAEISEYRKKAVGEFGERLGFFAKKLLIGEPRILLSECAMSALGIDSLEIFFGNSAVTTLSAGEYRRLRLAVMACENSEENAKAVLFLDEADANLSGEESAGVAFLLRELSQKYQIFAISHQPQLASAAKHHFVVYKEDGQSFVKRLSQDERVNEIARMVSSGEVKKEAIEYARQMLREGEKCL